MAKEKGEQLPPVLAQLPAQENDADSNENPQDVVWGFPVVAAPKTTAKKVVVAENGFAPDPNNNPFDDS